MRKERKGVRWISFFFSLFVGLFPFFFSYSIILSYLSSSHSYLSPSLHLSSLFSLRPFIPTVCPSVRPSPSSCDITSTPSIITPYHLLPITCPLHYGAPSGSLLPLPPSPPPPTTSVIIVIITLLSLSPLHPILKYTPHACAFFSLPSFCLFPLSYNPPFFSIHLSCISVLTFLVSLSTHCLFIYLSFTSQLTLMLYLFLLPTII